jgi:hypothetical protein
MFWRYEVLRWYQWFDVTLKTQKVRFSEMFVPLILYIFRAVVHVSILLYLQYTDITHGINIGGSPPYKTSSDLQDMFETDFYIYVYINFILYILYINILCFNIIHNLNYIKLLVLYSDYNNNNNNNHGSTALYGLGPPLSEVTWSCAFVAEGDQPTGRAVRFNPDVTARVIWQSVRGLGWEMAAEFCLRNISIHARKVLLHAVNLRHGTDGFTRPRPGLNPQTLGPVASTLTTSPPRAT